jgi:hypothetical protein
MTKTLAQIKDDCSVAANESKRDYRTEFQARRSSFLVADF